MSWTLQVGCSRFLERSVRFPFRLQPPRVWWDWNESVHTSTASAPGRASVEERYSLSGLCLLGDATLKPYRFKAPRAWRHGRCASGNYGNQLVLNGIPPRSWKGSLCQETAATPPTSPARAPSAYWNLYDVFIICAWCSEKHNSSEAWINVVGVTSSIKYYILSLQYPSLMKMF